MSVANGTPTNARASLDENYIVSVALPNAANTVNTSGMDLIQAAPYPTTNRVDVNFVLVGGNGANNKNINVVWQQSNDNGNWTNVNYRTAPLFQVVDNNGAGQNNANVILSFDVNGWRYIRAQATGEANGGNAANGTLTLQLLF
jgi:hypothetical protein